MNKAVELLNTILNAGSAGNDTTGAAAANIDVRQSFESYAAPSAVVTFWGAQRFVFEDAAAALRTTDRRLVNAFAVRDIKHRAVQFIDHRFQDRTPVTPSEAAAFIASLAGEPLLRFTIYRELFGVAMMNPANMLKLGPYTICHYPTVRGAIVDGPTLQSGWDWKLQFGFAIGTDVSAATALRAQEQADDLFERFDRFIRFFVGPGAYVDIAVLSHRGRGSLRSMTLQDGSMLGAQHSTTGALHDFPIDVPGLQDTRMQLAWRLADPERRLTSLGERIVRAIEWTGDACREPSLHSAFLKAAVALELLLVGKDVQHVSASVSARLAETLAMLVGRDIDERLSTERKVKRLYGIRSAIAHSGRSSVTREDFHALYELIKKAVFVLLEDEALRDMESIEMVLALLARKRYSFTSFAPS